jgi:hypothetical protein
VLIVYGTKGRKRPRARFSSRRPWAPFSAGDTVVVNGRELRVTSVSAYVIRRRDTNEHRTVVTTRAMRRLVDGSVSRNLENVVAMPLAAPSPLADFLRYHVLVRVFGGDADAWLARLDGNRGDPGDVRFVRALRARLRRDPALLDTIRRMVDTTRFWSAAEA